MLRIALFTPNKNPYSETFVQAHKNLLKDEVSFYYGSIFNINLEGHYCLTSKFNRVCLNLVKVLTRKSNAFVREKMLLSSLRKRKIDVILVEYGVHAYSLLPVIKKSKLPMVVHFHGYDASAYEAIEKCNNYKEVFEYTSKVIVVSTKMKQDLVNLGCSPEKLVYTPCGPNPDFKEVRPKFSTKQFVGIGRFVDKKAPYYTILAFNKVLRKYKDAKLIIGGDGELYNTCVNLVKHLKIEDNVLLPGVISKDELVTYLSESLAFVQHSITAINGDTEGTPVSVMEAGLSGLPVISTKHAGIQDVIIDGETGLLGNEHDVDKMAEAMIFVLENKEKSKKMGEESRKNIQGNYSQELHIAAIQKALEDSLSK